MGYTRTYPLLNHDTPDLSYARFVQELSAYNSPALSEAHESYNRIVDLGASVRGCLAMFGHESGYGLFGICNAYHTRSPGNVRTSATGKGTSIFPPGRGEFQAFESWVDGWTDMILRWIDPDYPYLKAGASTIETIIPIFAPKSDDNDPENYIADVLHRMNGYDMIPDRLATMGGIPVVFNPAHLSNWKAGHGPYELIVIHDIEGGAASAVQRFQTPNEDASAHIVADPDNNRLIQMVGFQATAWTATNDKGNDNGLNIELPGYAGRIYDPKVITFGAAAVGTWAALTGIPIDRRLSRAEANATGVRGICGHQDLQPHPGYDQHTDPGPTFPWDAFLQLARDVRDRVGGTVQPGPFFPETGFGVLGGILTAFTNGGGVARFGYPRSWEYDTNENGVTLRRQWFERASAEWLPNRINQPDVTWALLGDAILDNWALLTQWHNDRNTRVQFKAGKSWIDAPHPNQ